MRISAISASSDHGAYRVSANVDGETLWFDSTDFPLIPSPEAYASAMLLPAISRGESLVVEDEISASWLANVSRILPVYHEWWGYPELMPQPTSVHDDNFIRLETTALCFSGGVDSFHTLLRSGHAIHYLVFVIGFDVALDDRVRYEASERSLRVVAAATKTQPIVIRTNLREHPAFTHVSWEFTHGGALAAIGHLLSDLIGQFLISASQTYKQTEALGSHWRTDRFWSSGRLQIVTSGAGFHRYEKVKEIAAESIVQANLRVCWENLTPTGNCSRCEKCVRTRLSLAECNELENYAVFKGAATLLEDLDALPHCGGIKLAYRALLRSPRLAPEMKRGIRLLIERTEKINQRRRRLEIRKKRLHQASVWLGQNQLWRKLPWRLRSWINSMMNA